MHTFFKSCVLGIAISSIFGPVTMLFIRKTLDLGLRGAAVVGLSTSVGTAIYGFIACLGLTAVINLLTKNIIPIKFVGGLVLFFMAYKELMINPKKITNLNKSSKNSFLLFFQTLFLTFLSPVTILFFINFFSELNLSQIGLFESFLMIVGIFLGSVLWYVVLGSLLLIFRKHLSESWLDNSRYFSAFLLIVLGVWSIGSVVI